MGSWRGCQTSDAKKKGDLESYHFKIQISDIMKSDLEFEYLRMTCFLYYIVGVTKTVYKEYILLCGQPLIDLGDW